MECFERNRPCKLSSAQPANSYGTWRARRPREIGPIKLIEGLSWNPRRISMLIGLAYTKSPRPCSNIALAQARMHIKICRPAFFVAEPALCTLG
jgi:hypothetical protein